MGKTLTKSISLKNGHLDSSMILRYTGVVQASSVILPPIIHNSNIVIYCELSGHKTWHWAGYVRQIIAVPGIGNCNFFKSSRISLNRPTFFKLDTFTVGYKIEFEKADWIESLLIKLYEEA